MVGVGTLLWLLQRAMNLTWPGQPMTGWALLATLLYALTDEYHRSFVLGDMRL